MKKIAFVLLSMLFVTSQLLAGRYLVASGGKGNGSSWAQAFGDVQQALAIAVPGDEIWVARGTYQPSQTGDRTQSFRIPSGVALYGGFTGTETRRGDRNWQNNQTVLSGNLGDPSDGSDNSQTIVYFDRVSSTTILDGFVLTDGFAKGFVRGPDPVAVGAAIFNQAADGISSPTIRNCVFRNNYARAGAAIYNYARNGRCEAQIISCAFFGNEVDFNGGAIFNDGDEGICNPSIVRCHFADNRAIYGASILNQAQAGVCRPLIKESVFINNHTTMSGSVIYNKLDEVGQVYATLTACQIKENYSARGSDVENNANANKRPSGYE